jgi:aryl-alcohol dehydrogenase-like predicted oxidoreductase
VRFPKVPLGRSGLQVSRIGFGSSYGASTRAYEEAFERGVNYFYWGSRRRERMGRALRALSRHHRDELVIVVQSYARMGMLVKHSLHSALRSLGIDYADVLLLGWHNQNPSPRLLDAALELRESGKVRALAVSGHRRAMFPELIDDSRLAIWHLRYNAVHRGAEREVFAQLEGRDRAERPGLVTYTTTRWGHLCDSERMPPSERTPDGTDCLRFALTQPQVDVVISGPSRDEHVHQAMRALELGAMNDDELAWMRRVGDYIYRGDATSTVRDAV